MSASLKQIYESLVYDLATQQWKEGVYKSTSEITTRPDGTTVEAALAAVPGAISDAVTALKGGVDTAGDTLAKLLGKITALQELMQSDDVDLDTVQELVTFIKNNRTDIDAIGTNKVNISDVVNTLDTVIEGKVLDARAGKTLKDLIDGLQTAVTALETQATSLATKTELSTVATAVNALETQAATLATKTELDAVAVAAIPVVSDTAPANPVDGQIWYKPAGTVMG